MARVKLGDVARESKEVFNGVRSACNVVGLEHLTPEDLILHNWDENVENTFTKAFSKGQVLFGRRRAYLKKAVVAPFNGVCSGDITVIEAIPGRITPELLPFIIQNDSLFDYAVGKSAGSLSPRVKWKYLKNYEFDLPKYDEQAKIAEILWSSVSLRAKYQEAIKATDELVKSQFIEMFGNKPKLRLSEIAKITMGQSPSSEFYNDIGTGLPFYQGKTEYGDMYINKPILWCSEPTRIAYADDVLLSVRAPVGSVNIAAEECCIGRGLAAISSQKNKSTVLFIFYALRAIENDIARLGVGSTFASITKLQVYNLLLPNASMAEQSKFVCFAQQADKLKFTLQQRLENLEKSYKALLQKQFSE